MWVEGGLIKTTKDNNTIRIKAINSNERQTRNV